MRATELNGMKVQDKNGVEIGKLSDLGINLDEFKIENILVSTGGFLSKKYFTVNLKDLGEIDNYIHLKRSKEDIDQYADLESRNHEYERYFFKDFQNIYVASADARSVGPVKDLCSDLQGSAFKIVIEATRGKFTKNDHFMINPEDITDIKEFIILNLKKDEIKQRVKNMRLKSVNLFI